MRAKTVLILVLLCLAVGFIGGFWPMYEQRSALSARVAELERERDQVRADLATAQATLRQAELLGRALALRDLVMGQNFGLAQQQATPFFDAVRDAAIAATPGSPQAAALAAVQGLRDTLVASLSTADARSLSITREIEERLRGALGYQVPQVAPGVPLATPSAPVATVPPDTSTP